MDKLAIVNYICERTNLNDRKFNCMFKIVYIYILFLNIFFSIF